jgi:hypothetical protein
MTVSKKMKFAIIIPMGLWVGGVEKFTQQIAVELALEGHCVDYFFTEYVQYVSSSEKLPGLDMIRKNFVEAAGVKTIKVECESFDACENGGMWNGTNLFDVFDPSKYDVVIGSHKGEPMWPFSKISGTKIVEFVHGTDFTSGASTYANAYILINEYQLQKWLQRGGIQEKTHIIAPMVKIDCPPTRNDRAKWGIPHDSFVYGLHQASRQGIFSPVQLDAYSKIQHNKNFFVVLGGGTEYQQQAHDLGLINFLQIPSVSSSQEINSFLSCLNVYAHGRFDGEVCSSAIIEAMANNLPIVSHHSNFNNGHINQLKNCGLVATSVIQYAQYMLTYENDKNIRDAAIIATRQKYENEYKFQICQRKLLKLLKEV